MKNKYKNDPSITCLLLNRYIYLNNKTQQHEKFTVFNRF